MNDCVIAVHWACPCCGADNIDDFEKTAFPLCGDCGSNFNWYDIASDEVLEAANERLIALFNEHEEVTA
jgi:hypothetical protein